MKHQPKIVLHSNGDSFPDSPQFANDSSLHFPYRRLCASKQKSTCNSNSNESLIDYTWFQGFDIGDYIWQFRHFYGLARRSTGLANQLLSSGVTNCQHGSVSLRDGVKTKAPDGAAHRIPGFLQVASRFAFLDMRKLSCKGYGKNCR
jgi:hypothetical protein